VFHTQWLQLGHVGSMEEFMLCLNTWQCPSWADPSRPNSVSSIPCCCCCC